VFVFRAEEDRRPRNKGVAKGVEQRLISSITEPKGCSSLEASSDKLYALL